jgi:hypothetical protein
MQDLQIRLMENEPARLGYQGKREPDEFYRIRTVSVKQSVIADLS